nr:MAG TPA: hypothetical protein [Caudoviricetes sp.]
MIIQGHGGEVLRGRLPEPLGLFHHRLRKGRWGVPLSKTSPN